MTLTFILDPELTPELRDGIVSLWTAVTNAGGAVGFVPPVTEDQVRVTAEKQFAGLGPGQPDRLLVGFEPSGRPAAALFFEDMRFDLMDHWRMLKRVMVDPGLQGRGYGAELMAEAARVGTAAGWAGLKLTLRGGQGLEEFYLRCGYTEVGRVPGAIRVAPGDDRDDVTMWLALQP
ncbi:GNAT family N-acetyltransferase [Kitasatospora sp. NPDC002040]|uniref:GNAT family N-acetyltransferase n=1 Tax=Kitasatospora sp. NPDC002040 TaxID=3154661 RepID=UPI00332E5048